MVPLFTAAIFVAAFLLFLIQPLAARLVLPKLGGSPAVWTGSMMFFQVLLLGGYAYAHAIGGLRPRVQGIIHAVVMLACVVFLPLALPAWWSPLSMPPLASLLVALLASVGLPFFAISATSPLLQAWFARTGHARAHDPYFLYAASNAGSLLGLLAYPLVVERMLGLVDQGWAWSMGFALCALLVGGSWWLGRPARSGPVRPIVAPLVDSGTLGTSAKRARAGGRSSKAGGAKAPRPAAPPAAPKVAPAPDDQASPWTQRLIWIALAAAPSSLSLGVTQFLTTDVAAIPLLWVIPLGLYLITYIVAFSRSASLGERIGRVVLPIAAVAVSAAIMLQAVRPLAVVGALHLIVLLAAGLACHGRLAALRPSASRLTEFYLLASLGGALGGAFNALVAPLAFDVVLEYPLAVAACCALLALRPPVAEKSPGTRPAWLPSIRPKNPLWAQRLRQAADRQPRIMRILWPVGAIILTSVYLILADAALALGGFDSGRRIEGFVSGHTVVLAATIGVPLIAAFALSRLRLVFAAMIATLAGQATLVPFVGTRLTYDIALVERSFFGVCMVIERQPFMVEDGPTIPVMRILRHGTTTHGQQYIDPVRGRDPLSYYTRTGPVGGTFDHLPDRPRTVAMIGLGVGSVAAYGRPGDSFDFFEIDPTVVHIARDSGYFTYLSDSPATSRVILGDGRLRIAQEPPGRYDLIILDAFSSDSIPVHLLTVEALRIYAERLRPGGLLLIHISNLHFDLLPPLARAASDLGLILAHRGDNVPVQASYLEGALSSRWVVLSPDRSRMASFAPSRGWGIIPRPDQRPAWTDDHANVLQALTLE